MCVGFFPWCDLSDESPMYARIVQSLATDERRNAQIAEDVRMALADGRTPIVLTTLTSHVERLGLLLSGASFRYTTAFNGKCFIQKEFFRTFIP